MDRVGLDVPLDGGKGTAGVADLATATGAAAAGAGAGEAVGAGGPPAGREGNLIVEAAAFGGGVGRGIRTVSFFG